MAGSCRAAAVERDREGPAADRSCGSSYGGGCPRYRGPMDTWHAINSVRVVREFTDGPVTPEHLERILNAARRAGSSKNQQSWAFITVRDREQLRKLAEVGHYAGHLAGAAVAIALVRPDARDEH